MRFIEIVTVIFILLSLLVGFIKQNIRKYLFNLMTVCFFILASGTYLGFFLPVQKYKCSILLDSDLPRKIGYPANLIFETKGIFAVNNPISVTAEIINFRSDNAKERFSKNYKELGFMWNDSVNIPPVTGISGEIETGQINLAGPEFKGRTQIKFTNPGKIQMNYILFDLNDKIMGFNSMETNSMFVSQLNISPAESMLNIKSNLTSTTIAIILLFIAVFNLLRYYWKF